MSACNAEGGTDAFQHKTEDESGSRVYGLGRESYQHKKEDELLEGHSREGKEVLVPNKNSQESAPIVPRQNGALTLALTFEKSAPIVCVVHTQ
jgi:hypothetical protein